MFSKLIEDRKGMFSKSKFIDIDAEIKFIDIDGEIEFCYLLISNPRKGFSHLLNWFRWYSVITSVGHFSAGPADLVAPHCTWYSCQAPEVRAFPNPLCLELTISGHGPASCPKLSISTLSASFGLFHPLPDSSRAVRPN